LSEEDKKKLNEDILAKIKADIEAGRKIPWETTALSNTDALANSGDIGEGYIFDL